MQAKGVKGILIRQVRVIPGTNRYDYGDLLFRVYSADKKSFVDHKIEHMDCSVIIDDPTASLYRTDDGHGTLDYTFEKHGFPRALRLAHQFSKRHRDLVEMSRRCHCFYCFHSFAPEEIESWTDDKQTAICPSCRVDAVLPDGCGIDITAAFLAKMHDYWFSKKEKDASNGEPVD